MIQVCSILIIHTIFCLYNQYFGISNIFSFYLYVFMYSITPYNEYLANPLRLFPPEITLTAYKELLTFPLMKTGYFSTLFVTVIGTALNIFLLCITAYPLSKRNLKGRNIIMALITFTMFFNGGMIPNYMLVRELHLLDTYWALIFPGNQRIQPDPDAEFCVRHPIKLRGSRLYRRGK